MLVPGDIIGDLLRGFYSEFGMPDEGPPCDVNITAMVGQSGIPEAEISILREALRDEAAIRQFHDCRRLIEELATRLQSEELLRELSGIPIPQNGNEQLSSGVFWFALAGSLDSRQDGLPLAPFDGIVQLPMPVKIQMSIHGSLVFRLYLALVYMREGVLSDLIGISAKGGGRCSARVKKLLNSDYVRHIRNALSHGTFSACIAGLVFRDNGFAIVATPGFLNWLCTWLMLIQLQALAAGAKAPHAA
jgi:hypothetical protein